VLVVEQKKTIVADQIFPRNVMAIIPSEQNLQNSSPLHKNAFQTPQLFDYASQRRRSGDSVIETSTFCSPVSIRNEDLSDVYFGGLDWCWTGKYLLV
jgi:hypothetical protein